MIEITRRDGSITIKGHAGYAERGQDIVCAAVSALTQVFIASVDKLTDDDIKAVISAGNTVIQYGDLTERAQVLLNSFFIGIQMIAEAYPAHVTMKSPSIEDVKSYGLKTSESFKKSEVKNVRKLV